MAHPLEPGPAEMRALVDRARDLVVGFVAGLEDADAAGLDGGEALAASLRGRAPEGPGDIEELLATTLDAADRSFNPTGPGYLAFIPGGGLFTSALGDFIARVLNRFVNLYTPSPPFAEMEAVVIRWFADLFGLPPEAGGLLTTGGSMANFSAIVTARRALLPEDFLAGTMYVSDQVHASVTKAAVLAGFPARNVRTVASDDLLRMDVDALRTMIDDDRRAGRWPFCVVASAGTTNTGAIDRLPQIAALCRREGLWLHVDAAYGGFFQLTERGRTRMAGIERADSITLDPHKGLFLPYGTGCLLVRDRANLLDAHRSGAGYLQDLASGDDIVNFADLGPELSRDPRGLRLWLPIHLHGLGAFRDALDEKLDLTDLMYEGLVDAPGLELPWEPELTVVPFRSPSRDAATQEMLKAINSSGRIFLSSTVIRDRFTVRPCILCLRTHRDRIEEAVTIIRAAASAVG